MGGNAIKIAERVHKDKFFKYVKEIIPRVESAFQTEVHMVNGYHDKEDFGDLDLLVLDKGFKNRRETIEKEFNPQEISPNSHIISFSYNELQVDLIFTSEENWNPSKIFFDWGDLGNFMGKLMNNYGHLADSKYLLKYGYDGLYCKIVHSGKSKKVLITKDNQEVFRFVGLNFEKWEEGFNNREEMFDYIIGSKLFDYKAFQWENLTSVNKQRNKKRPNYLVFLDYIEDHKNSIDWNKGEDFYLEELKNFFGVDLKKEKDILIQEVESDKIAKEKFNGKLVMKEFPELKGKELGDNMKGFKSYIDNVVSNWDDYVKDNDRETIIKDFGNWKLPF